MWISAVSYTHLDVYKRQYRGDYNLICCGNKVNLALRNREEKETEIFVI